MNKKQAARELGRLASELAVGTSTLRETFGGWLINWHDLNEDFNPIALVAKVSEGGYRWSCYYVFKNTGRTFAIIKGSGCSCDSPKDKVPEIFPDEDSALRHIRSDMDGSGTGRSKDVFNAYGQFMTWIVEGRK